VKTAGSSNRQEYSQVVDTANEGSIIYRAVLECSLCKWKAFDKYAMDRMQAMVNHWHKLHHDGIVPQFDQDTWRTTIVKPLAYTPAAQQHSSTVHAPQRTLKPRTATEEPQQALVATTEITAPVAETLRLPSDELRYQTTVILDTDVHHPYHLPVTVSPKIARRQNEVLTRLLSALLGQYNVRTLDYDE
jgi:hypothetical protein